MRTLDLLFGRAARRVPGGVVVRDGGGRIGYGEAEARATRLASALLRRGVELGEPVVVHCADLRQALVAQLAVLKAGGVCVPVPCGRWAPARIAEASGARTVLCSAATRTAWDRQRGLVLAVDDPATWILADALPPDPALPCSAATEGAYLLFAEEDGGSLGCGQLTDHRAWQLMLSATVRRLGAAGDTVLVSEGPPCARMLTAMWWAVACGGTLQVRAGGGGWGRAAVMVSSPEEYGRLLAGAAGAAGGGRSVGPRAVLLLGRPCPPGLAERHFEVFPGTRLGAQFVPAGGSLPWAMREFSAGGDAGDLPGEVAVGRPLPHVRLQVLGSEGEVLGAGATGEVCASGPALAYDRIPAPGGDPQAPDAAPLLRSGRLGRWRADGTVAVTGHAPRPSSVMDPADRTGPSGRRPLALSLGP